MHSSSNQAAISSPAGIVLSEKEVLSWAQSILEARFKRSNYLTSPQHVKSYLIATLANEEREVFGLGAERQCSGGNPCAQPSERQP